MPKVTQPESGRKDSTLGFCPHPVPVLFPSSSPTIKFPKCPSICPSPSTSSPAGMGRESSPTPVFTGLTRHTTDDRENPERESQGNKLSIQAPELGGEHCCLHDRSYVEKRGTQAVCYTNGRRSPKQSFEWKKSQLQKRMCP